MNRAEFAEHMLIRMLDRDIPNSVAMSVWHSLWHADFVGNEQATDLIVGKLSSWANLKLGPDMDVFKRLYKVGD